MKLFSEARGPLARRSRRGIGWALVAFVVVNGGLALLLDQLRPERRDPEYRLVADHLHARKAEQPDDPLILFLGSSRIALGVDAGELTEPGRLVFNFGIPGSGPFMMNVCWDRLAEEGIRPDTVFIEVMHPFYNIANGRTLDNAFLDASRLSVHEARGLVGYGNRSTGALRRIGIARVFPASRHGLELCESFGLGRLHPGKSPGPWDVSPNEFGYRALEIPVEMREEMRQLAHKQYDSYYPNFTLAADPASSLRDLVRKIHGQGITVKLLLTPEGSEFRNLMSPAMAAAINDFMAGLRAEFRLEVIDARDWLPDEAFYDQHHLLPAGGKLFAERLKPRLPPVGAKRVAEMPR